MRGAHSIAGRPARPAKLIARMARVEGTRPARILATMKHTLTAGIVSLVAVIALASHPPGSAQASAQALQKITINFPTRSGASWPLFIAKEGGYYQKYGLDVELVFAGHPAGIAMVVSGEAKMSSYNLESV